MRTLERWQETVMPKILVAFTPRIQQVVKNAPFPLDISEMKEVPSEFIYGDTEHGKTIRSVFLLLQESKNQYMNLNTDKKDLLFVSVPDLFQRLKKSFDNKVEHEEVWELIERINFCHLLVLDDLGVNKSSEWANEVLYNILNYRYEYMKKTIITSNKSIQELSEQFGDDRITSRIQRMCEIVKKKNWKD